MSKKESYSLTPNQIKANKDVFKASYVVVESFKVMTKEGNFEALTDALTKESTTIFKDLHLSQKALLDRCIKLSDENEVLKLLHQSTEQERKDQKENQRFLKTLIEENDRLKEQLSK